MPLFLMGCFPVDFQEAKRPLGTKLVKRPNKVGKRPIKEGKRPIKAKVLVGVSVGSLMGCFRAPPPWRKTAPLKRPIKRSMKKSSDWTEEYRNPRPDQAWGQLLKALVPNTLATIIWIQLYFMQSWLWTFQSTSKHGLPNYVEQQRERQRERERERERKRERKRQREREKKKKKTLHSALLLAKSEVNREFASLVVLSCG